MLQVEERATARRSKEAGGAKGAKGMLEVSLQPQITLEEHHKKGWIQESQVREPSYFVVDVWRALGRPILYNVHRMPIVTTHLLIVGTEGGVCSPTAPKSYP